ncbi:MAG: Polyhydroxyalkanoic acid synthase [Nitrosopumilus sp.]|nr:Polyhydroxyalkanoic acid synthase [Candidatus Nitrosopumilus limneticus]MDC4215283.1 hypothetical protein [Candidatus Nitrosopumilus limneticus]
MTPLEKTILEMRKKRNQATKLKQNAENQLKQLQFAEKRSATGLQKMIKQIEYEKENISDVSENLTRKNAQVESINRLVSAAEERLNTEKQSVEQVEQEIEFAESPEEKQNAEDKLRSLNDHIQELISEIKNRHQTLKKITEQVSTFDVIKSKITTQIKKQTKSKPTLRTTVNFNHQNIVKVMKEIEKQTKDEERITKALGNASSKLKDYLAKKTASKRRPAKKTASKRRPAKKTASKRRPAKKTASKRRPAKKTYR